MTRLARMAVATAVIVSAVAVDAWLVRRPEPHSVAEFSPFKTRLGREELILKNPVSQDGALLSHEGAKNEAVDIFFEKATLSDSTRQLLRQQPWAQSGDPQTVAYTTLDSPGARGAPCRTFVKVTLEKATGSEIRIFQSGVAGGDQHREIELQSAGSRLVVDFLTAPSDPAQSNQPGCRKLLQVGAGQIALSNIPMTVVAEAGSAVRLKFMPASDIPLWKGTGGFYEPFQAINLHAPSVLVSPIGSPQVLSGVYTADSRPAVYVDNLLIGSNVFHAGLSGVGMVVANGRLVGPTLSEWASASSVRTTLVAFLNLSLFCGAVLFMNWRRPLHLNLTPQPPRGIVPPTPANALKVFLCHCSEDKPAVRQLNRQLEADGFGPWLDEEDIFPGRLWSVEIQEGLHSSHAIVVCLSKVFESKEGFVQKELGYALDIAEEKPEKAVFLIPVRIEQCNIPGRLQSWQCIDLFVPGGYDKLKLALHERASQVGIVPRNSSAANA